MLPFEKLKHLILKDIKLVPIGISGFHPLRQSDFDRMSNVMQQYYESIFSDFEKVNLGTCISTSTLERLFKGNYEVSEGAMDMRKRKTLDKLCIFIGYRDWVDFLQQCNSTPNGTIAAVMQDEAPQIIEMLKKALQAEFTAYKSLPQINVDILSPCFIAESSAYMRIISVINRLHLRNWTISNALNPSTFELLDISVKQLSPTEAEVITREYWYLRWYPCEGGETTYIYNETNEQIYRLHKEGDVWKIWVNAYPPPKRVWKKDDNA